MTHRHARAHLADALLMLHELQHQLTRPERPDAHRAILTSAEHIREADEKRVCGMCAYGVCEHT